MSTIVAPQVAMTVEELAARVGAIPLWRIRVDPLPGFATEEDVERTRREGGLLCELIDGVLVEKAMSEKTAFLAAELGRLIGNFVTPRRIGWILGPDGFVRLFGKHLRAPDVSFIRRDQRLGGKLLDKGYADVAPALAVEVFSPSNTVKEMERKRREFFAAGCELFWIVDPELQEIAVYTDPDTCRTLRRDDTLDGGTALPGFSLKVVDLFLAIELGGDANA